MDRWHNIEIDCRTGERKLVPMTEAEIAEAKAREVEAVTLEIVKAECKRRIFSVASEVAQMNMASFAAAGLFDAAQKQAYSAGLLWVMEMRATCPALVANVRYADDAHWPVCPDAARHLASLF